MGRENNKRNTGLIVIIVLVVVALIVIILILCSIHSRTWKEGFNRVKNQKGAIDKIREDGRKELPLIDESIGTPNADGVPSEESSTDTRIKQAEINKQKNVQLARPTLVEQEAIPGGTQDARRDLLHVGAPFEDKKAPSPPVKAVPESKVKPVGARYESDVKHINAKSVFDIFSPKENTLELYGVTDDELRAMVKQYREEHKYEVPVAPSTLTFNINKWEKAQEKMRVSAGYIPQMKRDTELGLIYDIQVDKSDHIEY